MHTGLASVYWAGIDHSSLRACMQMLGIKKRKQRDVLLQVQVIESEARLLRNAK